MRVLVTMPPDRKISNVSEDDDGLIWILAADETPPGPDEHHLRAWFVAELTRAPLEWTPLVGSECTIVGATTVCATEGGTSVRRGRQEASWLDVPGGAEYISQLGFSYDARAHLGFEQSELTMPAEEPRAPELDARIHCAPAGAARRETAPPKTVIAALEALVDRNVHPTKWSALRVRAVDVPIRQREVADVERVDRFGLRTVLRGSLCPPRASGKPMGLAGAHVEVTVADGDGLEYAATVLGYDDGDHVCLQSILATRDDQGLLFDVAADHAEAWGPGARPLRCALSYRAATQRE